MQIKAQVYIKLRLSLIFSVLLGSLQEMCLWPGLAKPVLEVTSAGGKEFFCGIFAWYLTRPR